MTPSSATSERFEQLDSLRGFAALVVVFFHFRALQAETSSPGRPHMIVSLVTHPFTAGHESVIFFFVLSGFVLALPYLNNKQQSYPAFLQRRVLRIYGPYLAALALAIAGCALWHSRAILWRGAAIIWQQPVSLHAVAQHVLFLGTYPSVYNWAFWTLVHEMRISLIFPLLYLAVKRGKNVGTWSLFAVCMLIGLQPAGSWLGNLIGTDYLATSNYAGLFVLGVSLATNREHLGAWFRTTEVWQRCVFAAMAFLLFEEGHIFFRTATTESPIADIPEALGAVGLIIVALNSIRVSAALKTVIPRFLGKISYSLYLVHCTVLFAAVAMLHGKMSSPVFFATYLTVAILVSWVFCLLVEEPFTRLSRHAAKKAHNAVP